MARGVRFPLWLLNPADCRVEQPEHTRPALENKSGLRKSGAAHTVKETPA